MYGRPPARFFCCFSRDTEITSRRPPPHPSCCTQSTKRIRLKYSRRSPGLRFFILRPSHPIVFAPSPQTTDCNKRAEALRIGIHFVRKSSSLRDAFEVKRALRNWCCTSTAFLKFAALAVLFNRTSHPQQCTKSPETWRPSRYVHGRHSARPSFRFGLGRSTRFRLFDQDSSKQHLRFCLRQHEEKALGFGPIDNLGRASWRLCSTKSSMAFCTLCW